MSEQTVIKSDFEQDDSFVGVGSQLEGGWKKAFEIPSVCLGVFAIWSAGPGIAEDQYHMGIYTIVTWFLALMILPWRKGMPWIVPTGMSFVSAAATSTTEPSRKRTATGFDDVFLGGIPKIYRRKD